MLPTASPKPLRPSSLETGIGGAHYSNIQELQTNSWGGVSREQETILVSLFAASVRRNQVGKTRKQIILHITAKSVILDVTASFRTQLRSDPTLESSGQISLLLQRQLMGYKTLEPTTKHRKATQAKLVLHICKQKNTHLNTGIGQLIAGAFFFGMRSCEYLTTPKG